MQGDNNDSEIRLMGLIISQSALIGVAVAIFDSRLWLVNDETWMNGVNYAMGAFAVQGLAYYLFKMFFERNLRERARITEFQRQQQNRFKNIQVTFDQRRSDMELRRQELELEKELRWMEQNPDQVPSSFSPSMRDINNQSNLGLDYHSTLNPSLVSTNEEAYQWALQNPVSSTPNNTPVHKAKVTESKSLGVSELNNMADELSDIPLKKDGTPDLRYSKNRD